MCIYKICETLSLLQLHWHLMGSSQLLGGFGHLYKALCHNLKMPSAFWGVQAALVISIGKFASFSTVFYFGNHLQAITTSCLAVSPCTSQAGDRNNYMYQKPTLLCKMKKTPQPVSTTTSKTTIVHYFPV